MGISYPYRINSRGKTSVTKSNDEYIREAIEQTLFTMPGERVNRPGFGTGIMSYLFAPAGDETMMALKHMIQSDLQRHLLDLIQVVDVRAKSEDTTIKVTVEYVALDSWEKGVAHFEYNAKGMKNG